MTDSCPAAPATALNLASFQAAPFTCAEPIHEVFSWLQKQQYTEYDVHVKTEVAGKQS